MARNGPVPSKLTTADVGVVKLASSTRASPLATHCAKSDAGQSTGNTMMQQGLTTRNNCANASMRMECNSAQLGILRSVLDTGTTSSVNAAPKPVLKTLSNQSVVFLTLQPPPLPCVQRLEQTSTQESFQATSDNKLLWVGNNAPVTTQTLQNNFLSQKNQLSSEKGYVPNFTHTLDQSLPQSPIGVSATVKEQLTYFRKQQTSHDADGRFRNIIINKGSGSVSSSPTNSSPSQFASSLPQPQQRYVLVKHIPNLLSNSRGKPTKHLADVGQNSIVKQQNSAIKVIPSTQKLAGTHPVYLAKPTHLSSKTPKESNIFYLVTSPNQPPTLISQSLLGPSMPPLISNQNSSSSSAKIPQYIVRPGPPHSSSMVCTSNTPLVQVKRTYKQEQGSMQQPHKKPKSTLSAISIKKEPEDTYEGKVSVLSSTKTRTIQSPLPNHHLPAVSNKFRNTHVGNIGDASSVNAKNQLLVNSLPRTDTASVKNKALAPSWGTSETSNSSRHDTKGPVVTSNVASCPTDNAMSSFIPPTNTKQTFGNNTPNHAQTRTMKTFIVTDKSGKARLFKVPSSTPASHLLYTLSTQCKGKKLQLGTIHQKASAGTVVMVRKVSEGDQVSLKPKGTCSKTCEDLEQGLSKGGDRTNKVGVKEDEQGTLTTEQAVPKTGNKFDVDTTQMGLQSPESKSAEGNNIVTKSSAINRKRVSRKRRRKKRPFCIKSHKRRRQTKSFNAKVTILDHNYSVRPKSCQKNSADKSKLPFKDMKISTSIDSESAKEMCNFETQLTEDECVIFPEKDHNSEKQIKVALPKVVLKPLKLKHVDHFKTMFLSESPVAEVNQIETKTSPGKVQDSLDRSDQNSNALNFKDSMDNEKFPQYLSNSAERRDLCTVLPSKITEGLTVSVGGNVDVEPEITIKCEDDLLQTPEATDHLEKQAEEMMEIPSDLSLMSSKDRIKILRERMRRREREIETLMRKDIKQESP